MRFRRGGAYRHGQVLNNYFPQTLVNKYHGVGIMLARDRCISEPYSLQGRGLFSPLPQALYRWTKGANRARLRVPWAIVKKGG